MSVDAGCIWKKQKEYERGLFFFLSKNHPYNIFWSIFSVPNTVFLTGDKEMKNTPGLRELSSGAV